MVRPGFVPCLESAGHWVRGASRRLVRAALARFASPVTSASPVKAAVALGSNVGDRDAHLRAAFEALAGLPLTTLVARSIVFETQPVGPEGQGAYLNAAAILSTTLPPRELLDALLDIERARGRERSNETRWGPRTLDLDLLLYG
ncbi:MAG TPA: 2-amino-4-hydroxy-6-hydroxymethyldihydropteridine diphosphokinase, partial [Phycisphaerales bacterium]|nr:2-amino-4-hydroxy-6-hydroxymethyldihydropteridine diphosphokinase [Phycisphaerales bacterium]